MKYCARVFGFFIVFGVEVKVGGSKLKLIELNLQTIARVTVSK